MGDTGAAIVNHPDVDKIAFTGSTEVGKIIRERTAGTGKKLSLELGGKSPFIVFDDADIDSAIEGVVDAIWFNQGQVCCAGSRLLVQEGVAERFIDKLTRAWRRCASAIRSTRPSTSARSSRRCRSQRSRDLVKKGVAEGATLWQPSSTCPTEGCFYPPTLFTNVAPSTTVAQEEIFGPVLVEMTFRTPEEAVALANNTHYGLAASIWSENINLALDIAPQAQGRRGVDQRHQPLRRRRRLRRLQGIGLRPRRGAGRACSSTCKPIWIWIAESAIWTARPKDGAEWRAPCCNPQAKIQNRKMPPPIDRTPKIYIGGKQARPDSGYSRTVHGADGEGHRRGRRRQSQGHPQRRRGGARRARAGAGTTAHNRAQVLYFIGENLSARHDEFAARLSAADRRDAAAAAREVDGVDRPAVHVRGVGRQIRRRGAPHAIRERHAGLNEPIGTSGIACPDEAPLLARS